MSDDNLEWYYVNTNLASIGPCSKSALKTAFTNGETTEESLCWNETLSDWTAIKDIAGLIDYLKAKPKPVIPPVPSKPVAAKPQPVAGGGGGGMNDILAARAAMKQRQQEREEREAREAAEREAAAAKSAKPVVQQQQEQKPVYAEPAPEPVKEEPKPVVEPIKVEEKPQQQQPQQQQAYQPEPSPTKATSETPTNKFGTLSKRNNEDNMKSPVVERNTRAVPAPPTSGNVNEKANWVELKTADGLFYYYNKVSKQTTWDKPDCLKSSDEMDKAGDWVWMPNTDFGFIPAKVIAKDTHYHLETEDGHKHALPIKVVLDKLNWLSMRRPVQDLVMLDDMNKPLILHALKSRFQKNDIYTNVGNILISINPYKRLPLYTPSIIDQYRRRGNKTMPPHVYLIADEAYTSLLNTGMPQSIVISGESGAGKTECTKQALQYLAEIAGSASNVEQKILASNPILEAFGNAKTVRNNNSSRFGKYVEINFDNNLQICGSTNTNYLLEKIRVVKQNKGERNYHAFYQLVRGGDAQLKSRFHLSNVSDFYYLSQSGCDTVEDMDDVEEYTQVINAMKELNWSDEEIDNVFRITAGILHLGNVSFQTTGDRQCEVTNPKSIDYCTELLKIDRVAFHKAVTTRVMRIMGQEPIDVNLSKDEAEAARDALAKFIYEKLFDWIVQRINQSIGRGNVRTTAKGNCTIGILDIFGFEIFENNLFEQLLINHTNQVLQLFFNDNTFKREEEVYSNEGIEFKHVDYIACEPCIELVEKRPHGILALIDEEIKMPKGNDQTFMMKLHQNQNKHANYKSYLKNKDMFFVEHYAGSVLYDSTGFVEKSRDQLNDDAQNVILASKCNFLVQLFTANNGTSGNKKATLGSKFSKQLNDLNSALNLTEPHYIRCIKPNPNKSPLEFHPVMVLEQLTYSGVFEAVSIRKHGYPFRYSHADFYQRFRCVLPKEIRYNYSVQQKNIIEGCKYLIKELNQEDMQIGKTRVLYRAKQHSEMELVRNVAIEALVIKMQAAFRGWYCRKLKARLLPLKALCITALKSKDLKLVESTLDQCQGCGYDFFEYVKLQKHRFNLLEEQRIEKELLAIVNSGNVEAHYEELCKILACSEEIGSDNPIIIKCRKVVLEIEEKRKAVEWLQFGVANVDEEKLAWALEKVNQYSISSPHTAAAQQTYDKIQAEKPIIATLEAEMAVGGFINEGDDIVINSLDSIVSQATSFGVITENGKNVLQDANVILNVRRTLSSAQGTKDKALWKCVAEACRHASERLQQHAEIQKACDEVAHQAEVDEITEKLDIDVQNRDQEPIAFGLDQCRRLRVDPVQYPIVEEAERILECIIYANNIIHAAVSNVNEDELIFAVKYSEDFGYDKPNVQKARNLRNVVMQLQSDSVYALDILEKDHLKDICQRADNIQYTSTEIEKCKTWVYNTSEEKFIQEQLKRSIKLQDEPRRIRCTIELKELVFKKMGSMFELDNYIRLRKPQDWADRKLLCLNREKLASSCRNHTTDGIHTSLTEHEEDSLRSEMSRKMFKNVLGIMGDRNYGQSNTLTQELLKNCIADPWLRDEVYCQVIKQLTNNPKSESRNKGFYLLRCLLHSFAPRPEFENYLGWWMKNNAAEHITLFHVSMFSPVATEPLNDMELQSILSGATLRKVNFDTVREYKPPVCEIPAPGHAAAHYEARMQKNQLAIEKKAADERAAIINKRDMGGQLTAEEQSKISNGNEKSVSSTPASEPVQPTTTPAPVEEDFSSIPEPPMKDVSAPEEAVDELPANWFVAYTENGEVYYYNAITSEVTWDRPSN